MKVSYFNVSELKISTSRLVGTLAAIINTVFYHLCWYWHHRLPCLPEVYHNGYVSPYSGLAAVVLSTVLANNVNIKNQVFI